MTPDEPEQFERITPVTRRTPAVRRDRHRTRKKSRLGWWVAGAGAAAVVLLAAVLILPRGLWSPQSEKAPDTVSEARDRLEGQAVATGKLRGELYQRWLKLESMDVSTWANVRAARALALLQEGEQLASDLDYINALRVLQESNDLLTALMDQAPGIAADRREAGWQAFRAGDANTAASHFRVVLAIEPDDQEVREALSQTAYLPEVLKLIRRARRLESENDLPGALAAMNEAQLIDPENTEVDSEVSRLEAALAEASFHAAMTETHAAIGAGKYQTARELLRRAASMRADAPEVRDAGIQIELAVRAARTARLRAQATEAELKEDWEGAIGLYGELLQIDPTLVLAQQGRGRARRLASLTTRAEALLEGREFFKDDVRERAETLLEQIGTVEASAPTLSSLAARVEQELALSRQPVTVRLQSDNVTEIVVFRVGRLGAFDRHELELLPGRYTVIGTRNGYRDVRAELVVEAGKEPVPLEIRCEEQI